MTNLDSILKSRDITLTTKARTVKAMVFPVVLYGCEIWTIKKAECRRIAAFELWYWRRLLRVPCTLRRSNQSILKEINSEAQKRQGLAMLPRLEYSGYLQARSHYWSAGEFWPAPFPTWANSPLLRQPGGPLLPGGHHIDAELSADTRSA